MASLLRWLKRRRTGGRDNGPIGQPEPEPNPSPEANLHKHVLCAKNPGHKDFIPIGEFSLEHLPEAYRDPWRLEEIKVLGDLTVRLRADVVSADRPEFYPGTKRGYPFHTPGGGRSTRTGSGYIRTVYRSSDVGGEDEDESCPCMDNEGKACEQTSWWCIAIATALHVVFDNAELEDLEIDLFFDSGAQHEVPELCKAKGVKVVNKDLGGDKCVFTAILHDRAVGERLENAWERHRTFRDEHPARSESEPVIVLSHPHGCSKHVTVGDRVQVDRRRAYDPITYTADTCPGSSGGMVWWREKWRDSLTGDMIDLPWWLYPHSAGMSDGTNRSGWGFW